MSVLNSLKTKLGSVRSELSKTPAQRSAKRLQGLKTTRLRLEGRAKLASLQSNEMNRILKAKETIRKSRSSVMPSFSSFADSNAKWRKEHGFNEKL